MTSKPLTKLYLEWLYPQVRINDSRRTDREYWDLLEVMLEKEFVWTVPNDDNRVADGLDVRMEFVNEIGSRGIAPELAYHPEAHLSTGASVLEVLVGLSRRLEFVTDFSAAGWAGQLVKNLGLHKKHDPLPPRKINQINDALDMLVWRTYGEDGLGGFFPLAWPEADQRKVELWDQMSSYIQENPRL